MDNWLKKYYNKDKNVLFILFLEEEQHDDKQLQFPKRVKFIGIDF